MRIPRIYTPQWLEPGEFVDLDPNALRHLQRVLRLRPGSTIWLFNGDGRNYAATLEAAGARVEEEVGVQPPQALQLTLRLGVSKGERMDFAVQKAVELGVTRITPFFAARSVVHLDQHRLRRRMAHWRGVMIGACEQSGRCYLPRLDEPATLEAAVETAMADCRLLLHREGDASLDRLPTPGQGVELMIGPEGGLEDREIRLASSSGFRLVRLGPRILRAETAPLAALAAIQMLWGDFRDDGAPKS